MKSLYTYCGFHETTPLPGTAIWRRWRLEQCGANQIVGLVMGEQLVNKSSSDQSQFIMYSACWINNQFALILLYYIAIRLECWSDKWKFCTSNAHVEWLIAPHASQRAHRACFVWIICTTWSSAVSQSAALVFIDKKQVITADPLKDQLSQSLLSCLPLITINMTVLTVKLFYFPQILHLSDEVWTVLQVFVLCDIFVTRKHFWH